MPKNKQAELDDVIARVLAKIKPVDERPQQIDDFLSELNSRIKKLKIHAKAILGGSFAKGVWLNNDSDVDIFVCFNPSKHDDTQISSLLENILLPWKPDKLHGSRDYFQIKGEPMFEIVPVLDIKESSDAKNTTDFSPRHTEWVNAKGGKIKDDIRLAKKFVKSAGAYGAESYRRGFSGHVIDVLVINAGGFLPLLKDIIKWKEKTVIDPNKCYKTAKDAIFRMNASKTEGPLVVVDPIDSTRNAGAAIGQEAFERIIEHAKKFLKKPSDFSFDEEVAPKTPGLRDILVKVTPCAGKEDVRGAKLLKAFETLKLKILDQTKLSRAKWFWNGIDEALFVFELENTTVPKTVVFEGPPTSMEAHAKAFRQKHKSARLVNGKLVAEERNPVSTFEGLAQDVLLSCKKQGLMEHYLCTLGFRE